MSKQILYHSTRDESRLFTASQAILQGLCEDGGLFVPSEIPALPVSPGEMKGLSYQEIAYLVMKEYLTDFTEEELRSCINNAYDEKFDTRDIAPVVKVGNAYYIELFHGATIAFKDMALSILPHLMTTSARKNNIKNDIVILTATSGDTGKAAMAGFADVPGTKIIVFYPKGGVSRIQELQMVTQKGDNTYVVGMRGNFDDAQTGVKAIFEDKKIKAQMDAAGYQFSSANSINIGRLVPQIVYYVNAYVRLLEQGVIKEGEKINITVPTGNFGNILAAWYAKAMGLPVDKLICASNRNKVLFDFFKTGKYDRNREFYLTSSPSMDILISSNLERMIYLSAGEDAAKTSELMAQLKSQGVYEITEDMKAKLESFVPGYADEEATSEMIKKAYDENSYVMDTHTAVAGYVYEKYREETGDDKVTVIASTASPYKFARKVISSIDPSLEKEDDLELMDVMEKLSGVKAPRAIDEIRSAPVRHDRICDAATMEATVKEILGM